MTFLKAYLSALGELLDKIGIKIVDNFLGNLPDRYATNQGN